MDKTKFTVRVDRDAFEAARQYAAAQHHGEQPGRRIF